MSGRVSVASTPCSIESQVQASVDRHDDRLAEREELVELRRRAGVGRSARSTSGSYQRQAAALAIGQ